tara:strand:+ start:1326 stop:1544 length:219 start_codon:yes stop_codon:yes gene_type:complete
MVNNQIHEVIKSKGLTKKFVCDKLDINYSVMSQFINGKMTPSQSRLIKLSKFLGVKVKDLYPHAKRVIHYEI